MIDKNNKSFSRKLAYCLLSATLLLLILHILLQYLNFVVFYQQVGSIYELANRFDLDDESSVGTWFSQFVYLCIGITSLTLAYLERNRRLRRLWQLLGAGGIIFSIDEVAGLHEFLLQSIHNLFFRDQSPSDFQNAWFVVLPIILGAGIWIVYEFARHLSGKVLAIISVSILVFLTGAVGVDWLTSLTERESFLHQGLLVGLEEALELLGAVMFFYATVVCLETKHPKFLQGLKHYLQTASGKKHV